VDEGDPIVVGVLRQAEVEVQAERRRDLVGEELADTTFPGVDPADELALVPAQCLAVVAVPGAGLPRWTLLGKGRRKGAGAGQIAEFERPVDRGQPGLMGEQLAYGDIPLPPAANSGQ
jgi:hypothetical protein